MCIGASSTVVLCAAKVVERATRAQTVRTVMSHLSREAMFFDLGAHIGQYTLVASPLCHAVHSFEAVAETFDRFDLLRRNVQVNGSQMSSPIRVPCPIAAARSGYLRAT